MRKVSDCDLLLNLHIGKEWAFVVDFEGEDAMLIGAGKRGAINGAVRGRGGWREIKSMKRGEH